MRGGLLQIVKKAPALAQGALSALVPVLVRGIGKDRRDLQTGGRFR